MILLMNVDNENPSEIEGTNTQIEGAGILDFELKGNTHQDSYTGKNLFDNVYGQNKKVYTKNIVANNPLGRVNCYPINLLPNTQYTLTVNMNGYEKFNTWISGLCFEDGRVISLLQYGTMADVTTTTFTTDSTGIVYVGHRYGYELDRMKLFLQTAKIQIEKGSTATEYEPFVGGSASPSPDYPQPIEVVTGNNTIKINGKNLFDKDSVVSGFVNADGTIGGDTNAYRTSNFIPIQPNTAYYKTRTDSPRTKYYDSNKQPLNTTTYQDISIGGSAGTFTTPNNAYYLRFSYPIASVDADSIQIEKGTSFTEYQPYQSKDYEISLGVNNLLSTSTLTAGYVSGNGDIHYGNLENEEMFSEFIKVEPNTKYTFKMFTSNWSGFNTNNWFGIGEYSSNDISSFIQRDTMTTGTQDYYTFTTTSTTQYLIISARGLNDQNVTAQLNKGDVSSYTPYGTTPIELCKIGDYQDYIYKENNKWYKHSEIGKVVLDGSETQWAMYGSSGQRKWYLQAAYFGDNVPFTNSIDKSNRFIVNQYISGAWRLNRFGWHAGARSMVFDTAFGDSLEEWKEWLASNNTSVYYVLATPTNEEITDTDLIEQLEAISNSALFDGVNYIDLNSDNLIGSYKITYSTWYRFEKILRSGYNINEDNDRITQKFANGHRKQFVSDYKDCIITLNLDTIDIDTTKEYLRQLKSGPYKYYSLENKEYKTAQFIIEKRPELKVNNSIGDNTDIDEYQVTLLRAGD